MKSQQVVYPPLTWEAVVATPSPLRIGRQMNSDKHACLTRTGRALLVVRVLEKGWSVSAAAQAMGVSYRTQGTGSLQDRRPGRPA